eukprot:scaffold109687_cov28-Tisochrysis_lutea.AAC.3
MDGIGRYGCRANVDGAVCADLLGLARVGERGYVCEVTTAAFLRPPAAICDAVVNGLVVSAAVDRDEEEEGDATAKCGNHEGHARLEAKRVCERAQPRMEDEEAENSAHQQENDPDRLR